MHTTEVHEVNLCSFKPCILVLHLDLKKNTNKIENGNGEWE